MRFAGYLQKIGALLGFLKVSDMRRMNVSIHKNRATSRRSRELNYQHHDVGIQHQDVPEHIQSNIATLSSNATTL